MTEKIPERNKESLSDRKLSSRILMSYLSCMVQLLQFSQTIILNSKFYNFEVQNKGTIFLEQTLYGEAKPTKK